MQNLPHNPSTLVLPFQASLANLDNSADTREHPSRRKRLYIGRSVCLTKPLRQKKHMFGRCQSTANTAVLPTTPAKLCA
jgi:hypothetical protein